MRNLGPTEIFLILAVIVLLFGAKKLPDLARGSGRALRIFKAETKGLMDDDEAPAEPKPLEAGGTGTTPTPAPTQVQADAETQAKPTD